MNDGQNEEQGQEMDILQWLRHQACFLPAGNNFYRAADEIANLRKIVNELRRSQSTVLPFSGKKDHQE